MIFIICLTFNIHNINFADNFFKNKICHDNYINLILFNSPNISFLKHLYFYYLTLHQFDCILDSYFMVYVQKKLLILFRKYMQHYENHKNKYFNGFLNMNNSPWSGGHEI